MAGDFNPVCDVDAEGWCDAHMQPYEACRRPVRRRAVEHNPAGVGCCIPDPKEA